MGFVPMKPQAGTNIPRLNLTKLLSHPELPLLSRKTKLAVLFSFCIPNKTPTKTNHNKTCRMPVNNSSQGTVWNANVFTKPLNTKIAMINNVLCQLLGS